MLSTQARWFFAVCLWLCLMIMASTWFFSRQSEHLAIAGGPRGSEGFELAVAIGEVYQQAYPGSRVEVFETSGSEQNVRLLTQGKIDLATLQADTPVREGVAAISILYTDAYQLIVDSDSDIDSFADLAARRIAIPLSGSGQHNAFWAMVDHFGIDRDAITALPMAESAANFAMLQGQVDALFRVRAPGNESIRRLVRDQLMRLVPIRQSAAMSLKSPWLSEGVIPQGAYRGYPALPQQDLPTALVERLLAVRANLDVEQVYKLTQVLFERRSELVARSVLAGFIRPMQASASHSLPVHEGALRYNNRDQPSFLQRHTRLGSALLSCVAIITSASFALRSRWRRRRRVKMGGYNRQLMSIAAEAGDCAEREQLIALKRQLIDILNQVIAGLDNELVSQDEFEHFSFAWQAVDGLLRDKLSLNVHTDSEVAV